MTWRTVSAVDGHRATGSFAFGLGATPKVASAGEGALAASSGPTPVAVAGRWLLYLGLLLLLGVSFFGSVIAPVPGLVVRRLLPVAWALATVGTLAVIVDELVEAGIDIGQALTTSFGPAIAERSLPPLIAGLAIAIASRAPGRTRPILAVVALAGAGALLSDVLSSHAAAGQDAVVQILVQALHVLAVALWLGGLAGLLLTVRGRTPDPATARAARRFSWLATIGIGAVAATGVLRAIRRSARSTGCSGATSAASSSRRARSSGSLPRSARSTTSAIPVRWARAERPTAGRVARARRRCHGRPVDRRARQRRAAVIGRRRGRAPSAEPEPSARDRLRLATSGPRSGSTSRSPRADGFDTFRATVTDYDSGAPVAARVSRCGSRSRRARDVGSSRLDLVPTAGAGVFSRDRRQSFARRPVESHGAVANGTPSVEVPLTVLAQRPSPTGRRQPRRRASRRSTRSTCPPAGRSRSTSTRTSRARTTSCTFFDAGGAELPATDISATVATASRRRSS